MDRITNPELPEDPRVFVEGDSETPATPLAVPWLNALQAEIIAAIVASGQTPSAEDSQQLLKAIQTLGGGSGGGTHVDVFTTSGTWTKPEGTKAVHLLIIGGGGGGASGQVVAQGTIAYGGGGGGGAAIHEHLIEARTLPGSMAVIVGLGGDGGVRASSPTPNAGKEGGDSIVSSGALLWQAKGGYPSPHYSGASPTYGWNQGSSGGSYGNSTNAVAGGGGGGGGGGGSLASGSSYMNSAGSVSLPLRYSHYTKPIDSAGNPGGGDGMSMDGDSIYGRAFCYPGPSGGGGGANLTGDGGNGGNGGRGSGGGGGGAARSAYQSGAGGRGGDGIVIITSWM